MNVDCRFSVDVFEVCMTFTEGLEVVDLWCDCDAKTDWCRHSTTSWMMLVHSISVAEGHETSADLPYHRDDVQLVQADPAELERVWRRRYASNTMAHSFLPPPADGRDE